MAQKIDWAVVADTSSATHILPSTAAYHYDLYNLTERECIVYGERRGDNINLRWGDPKASNNIRFQRQLESNEPIKSGELIAINVRSGGFLVYESGRWGINLGWASTPRFEWKLVGARDGGIIAPGTTVGLYNTVEKDYIIYEERDWGINLKWLKDAGKYNRLNDTIEAGKNLEGAMRIVGTVALGV